MPKRSRKDENGQATAPDALAPASFAERLDRLFRQVHPKQKAQYTYEEVATGATEAGFEISPAYVWLLRTGKRTNPTLRHIQGLAAFFGVPASYFLDPEVYDRVDPELEFASTLRDAGIRRLALRAHGLSADALEAVQDMVEHVRRLEGVADHDDNP